MAIEHSEALNSVMPHSAFGGQTPDEIYFGRGTGVGDRLANPRREVLRARMEANRREFCAVCRPPTAAESASDSRAVAIANTS